MAPTLVQDRVQNGFRARVEHAVDPLVAGAFREALSRGRHAVWFDEANVPVALRSGNTPIGVRRNMDINHALFVAKGVAEPVAGYI